MSKKKKKMPVRKSLKKLSFHSSLPHHISNVYPECPFNMVISLLLSGNLIACPLP